MSRDLTKEAMNKMKQIMEEQNSPAAADNDLPVGKLASQVDDEQAQTLAENKPRNPQSVAPEVYENRGPFEAAHVINPQKQPPTASTPTEEEARGRGRARGASKIDLANLSEENVMDIPYIKATAYDIPDIFKVRPKDPAIRFRAVNFKNHEGGNHAMFKAMGFVNAKVEDCENGTLLESYVKEDGTIKFYDVILMKIHVLDLMPHLKRNILRSMNQVGDWSKTARQEAQKTFDNNVGMDLKDEMRKHGYTVDFYNPNMSEVKDLKPNFGG